MTVTRALVWAAQLERGLLALGALAAAFCWAWTGDLAWAPIAAALAVSARRLGRDPRRPRLARPAAPLRRRCASRRAPVAGEASRAVAGPATGPLAASTAGLAAGAVQLAAPAAAHPSAAAAGRAERDFAGAFGRLLALVGRHVQLTVRRPGTLVAAEGVLRADRRELRADGERFRFALADDPTAAFWIARAEVAWACSDGERLVIASADTLVELRGELAEGEPA